MTLKRLLIILPFLLFIVTSRVHAQGSDVIFNGAIVAGDCAKWLSAGVLQDAGAACGAGGGGIMGLTTGFFPKAASATTIANSLCDEGITTANTLTCTDTAGIAAKGFAASGSTAGFFQCTAGTANGHATASTITIECPTSATAYELQLPIAAATGIPLWTNTAGVVAETIVTSVGVPQGGTGLGTLTSNVVYKGNGTGNIAVSSMTDNGTNVTSTDTGGFIAPVFVSNGTTAGFIDLPQGTTSTAVAPCNAATSICIQAPTSVTSYLLNLPGAAATGMPSWSNSSGTVTESIQTYLIPDGTSQLSIGPADTTNNGILGLKGKTSGTATFTAPAVAGTTTNAVTMTNVLAGPAGAAGTPTYGLAATNLGMFSRSSNVSFAISGTDNFDIGTNLIALPSSGVLQWFSGTLAATSVDTTINRAAAGVFQFGTTSGGDSKAKLKASGYMSVGTKFTTNNGCTDSATAGGATAGTFTVGSTSCTEVITMGDTATAPNGWSCTVVDITTLADVTNPHQTTSNATTATIVTGTVVSGDKIQFSCIGY